MTHRPIHIRLQEIDDKLARLQKQLEIKQALLAKLQAKSARLATRQQGDVNGSVTG